MTTARRRLAGLIIACTAVVAGLAGVEDRTLEVTPAATAVEVAEAAPASHLPAYDVCAMNLPHPGSDRVIQAYRATHGDDHYACIGGHGYGAAFVAHYYIVCHDTYYWWWVPGYTAWLSGDCTP